MSVPFYQSVAERIRAEYLEMPGMHLTLAQLQRLCGVDRHVCVAVLDAFVDAGFLRITADGAYARVTDGPSARRRVAKAPSRPPIDARRRAAS